ncbi:MAG: NAD(P)-binding domain-containing protein, partial [Proteobacteria bacterium]|nr:NAD(P)-binding domain-containing protein [Pseudomonadota bacterium]
EKAQGGRGILLGGVSGVAPGKVTIIGGGVVGSHAAQVAIGMGADVTILDRSLKRLNELETKYAGRARCVEATASSIEENALAADLVIGAVLIPGASAPKVLTADIIKRMHTGSVVVDVAIDQGGCFETSKPTTHDKPVYILDGVVHYCVTNMPGAVARTSTLALNNATLPFVSEIADKGFKQALRENSGLRNGLNVSLGKVTHPAVAEALGYQYIDPATALEG